MLMCVTHGLLVEALAAWRLNTHGSMLPSVWLLGQLDH